MKNRKTFLCVFRFFRKTEGCRTGKRYGIPFLFGASKIRPLSLLILPKIGGLDILPVFCYTICKESRVPRDRARLSNEHRKVKRTHPGFGIAVRFFASAERRGIKIYRSVERKCEEFSPSAGGSLWDAIRKRMRCRATARLKENAFPNGFYNQSSRGLLPSFASQNPPPPGWRLGFAQILCLPTGGKTLDFHALYSLPQRGKVSRGA